MDIDNCAIVPWILVQNSLAKREHDLSDKQVKWFDNHVYLRIKRMYEKLNHETDNTLLRFYMWVEHWSDAYILDPETFEKRHPPLLKGN